MYEMMVNREATAFSYFLFRVRLLLPTRTTPSTRALARRRRMHSMQQPRRTSRYVLLGYLGKAPQGCASAAWDLLSVAVAAALPYCGWFPVLHVCDFLFECYVCGSSGPADPKLSLISPLVSVRRLSSWP